MGIPQLIGASAALPQNKLCQTNLISFFDIVLNLVTLKKILYIVYVDFSKVFSGVSHSILLHNMIKYWPSDPTFV